jgi:hypothetical protein
LIRLSSRASTSAGEQNGSARKTVARSFTGVVHLLADQFLGFQPVVHVALRLSTPLLIEFVGFLAIRSLTSSEYFCMDSGSGNRFRSTTRWASGFLVFMGLPLPTTEPVILKKPVDLSSCAEWFTVLASSISPS